MNIKIEIKTKGKGHLNPDIIHSINQTMEEYGYTNVSIKEARICDGCEVILPADYPKELELCPNCETGKQDAIKGSI